MKALIGVAAAALLLATPALAQTDTQACAFQAPPSLIDGADSSHEQMTSKGEEVTAWVNARQAQEARCQAEIQRLQAELQPLIDAYNASGPQRVSTVQAWNAEVTEFGARPQQRERTRGGVLTRPDN